MCEVCNNLAVMAIASGVTMECCGDPMTCLKANVQDEGHEKHLPVCCEVECHKMKIMVGSQPHPATREHHIVFICLHTDKEVIIHYFDPEEVPEAVIRFDGKPIAVYAYCNIHGLWKTDIPCEKDFCPAC